MNSFQLEQSKLTVPLPEILRRKKKHRHRRKDDADRGDWQPPGNCCRTVSYIALRQGSFVLFPLLIDSRFTRKTTSAKNLIFLQCFIRFAILEIDRPNEDFVNEKHQTRVEFLYGLILKVFAVEMRHCELSGETNHLRLMP